MDESPRFFTLDEANALIPTLTVEMGRVARLRSELGALIAALGGADAAVAIIQEGARPPQGLEQEAARLRQIADEITSAIERVTALGCVVKDVDAGLVDFYALQDDEPVFLCWQFGEPSVAHWHALDEGFAGRKPIEGADPPRPQFVN
jgi:hypothetical protein